MDLSGISSALLKYREPCSWLNMSRVISSFRSRAAWEGAHMHALALLEELGIRDSPNGTLGNIGTGIQAWRKLMEAIEGPRQA